MVLIEVRKLGEGTDLGKHIKGDHNFHFGQAKFERHISHIKGCVKRISWILESGAQGRDQKGRHTLRRH